MNRTRSQTDTRPRAYVVDKIEERVGKPLIALNHGCYICGNVYSSATYALDHVYNAHRIDLPSRIPSVRRPQDRQYDYIMARDAADYDEEHYACPCCWFHCPLDELEIFHIHTVDEHNPMRIAPESEDENGMGTNSRRRRPLSRPLSRQSNRPRSSQSIRRKSFSDSRPSSRQSNRSSRSSSRQGHVSGEKEEPVSRPSSRQGHVSGEREGDREGDRERAPSLNDDSRKELTQKIDELRDLFRAFFRS
ncbi:hypothetical protein BDF21DRAFT_398329 [Thamnidium elegans]|nr:hypothetical protein BDF21DRAFT_398329 [Thamnidium elegans]